MNFEAERDCFICFESTPPVYRLCQCNVVVHEHCITRLCKMYNTSSCTVCRQPFPVITREGALRCVQNGTTILTVCLMQLCALAAVVLLCLAGVMMSDLMWYRLALPLVYATLALVLIKAAASQVGFYQLHSQCLPCAMERDTITELDMGEPESAPCRASSDADGSAAAPRDSQAAD